MQALVYFDGGAIRNPGPAACAFVLKSPYGGTVEAEGFFLGRCTSNYAEYMGLIHGLERALALGYTSVRIYGDSQLVVRQMRGQYKVRARRLRALHERARRLFERFEDASIEHISRWDNMEADHLLHRALRSPPKARHNGPEASEPQPPRPTRRNRLPDV